MGLSILDAPYFGGRARDAINCYRPDPTRQRLRLSRSPDFDKQQTDGLKVNL